MTNRYELTRRVEELNAALAQAQEDVALLERLTAAKATAKRLSAELAEAQEKLSIAMADEVQARREAAYASVKAIQIDEGNLGEGVLGRTFKITLTRCQWNGYESAPVTTVVAGFDALPDDAWGYLLNVRPDLIPASIMALSPEGDARDAFNTYFTGMKRGYIASRSAA